MYRCETCSASISASRYRRYRFCIRHHCRAAWFRGFWHRVRKGALCGEFDMQQAANQMVSSARRMIGPDCNGASPIVVPDNSRRIVNLPEKRKRAFRQHVMARISAASAQIASKGDACDSRPTHPASDATASTDASTVLQTACATCQGRCCWPGQNTGLITVHTISSYMCDHPELRPRDVLATYLERLPAKTYEAS